MSFFIFQALVFLMVSFAWCTPFKVFQRHSTPNTSLLPRVGRNSKVMVIVNEGSRSEGLVKEDERERVEEVNVGKMLKDLERKLAEVKKMEAIDFRETANESMKPEKSEDVNLMANDLVEDMMTKAVSISEQKDRELRAKDSNGFDLEHSFSLQE